MPSEYNIRSTDDIFDVVLKTIGDFNNTILFIQENSLENADIDFEEDSNFIITYTPPVISNEIIKNQLKEELTTREIISKDGQTIFDLALMSYGSLDYLYALLQSNDIDNINDAIPSNLVISFDNELIQDVSIFNTIQNRQLVYNTDEEIEVEEVTPVNDGIFDLTFDLTFN